MRQAADELRAELAGDTVTFVVNRNINVSNVCIVGCAFCGFGQGRRSPDAYTHERDDFVARIHDALAYGATELCIQSGIHPDWTLEDYESWLRLAEGDRAGHPPARVLADGGRPHVRPLRAPARRRCSRGCARPAWARCPGTAAEVLHDGVRERISPNKLPAGRWVEIIEAAHRSGLRSTVTVMFGHIEEPHELAEHMRVVRSLQERTGGFTEFVPLSFIPFHTLLGRTHGIEEISREENLKHTAAFRLALGHTVPSVQASWVKMGLDAATEALRWGVNDLGGTLMEESISRLAGSYHGVKLDPGDLVAAAHARRAAGGRADDPVRDPAALPAGRRRGLSDHADVGDVAEERAGRDARAGLGLERVRERRADRAARGERVGAAVDEREQVVRAGARGGVRVAAELRRGEAGGAEQRHDPPHQPRVVDEHVEHRLGAALQRVGGVAGERSSSRSRRRRPRAAPPGRSTRRASASARSGSGTWHSDVWKTTASKPSSRRSSARPSPTAKVRSGGERAGPLDEQRRRVDAGDARRRPAAWRGAADRAGAAADLQHGAPSGRSSAAVYSASIARCAGSAARSSSTSRAGSWSSGSASAIVA